MVRISQINAISLIVTTKQLELPQLPQPEKMDLNLMQ